jgi:hypothetical protein
MMLYFHCYKTISEIFCFVFDSFARVWLLVISNKLNFVHQQTNNLIKLNTTPFVLAPLPVQVTLLVTTTINYWYVLIIVSDINN